MLLKVEIEIGQNIYLEVEGEYAPFEKSNHYEDPDDDSEFCFADSDCVLIYRDASGDKRFPAPKDFSDNFCQDLFEAADEQYAADRIEDEQERVYEAYCEKRGGY